MNFLKNRQSNIFLFFLVFSILSIFLPTSSVSATSKDFYVGNGNPCFFSGNISLNKSNYSQGEQIVASAYVSGGFSCFNPGWKIIATDDNNYTNQTLVYGSGVGQGTNVYFTAPNQPGTYTIWFVETLFVSSGNQVQKQDGITFTVSLPAAPTVNVFAADTSIPYGYYAQISWSSTGATSCSTSANNVLVPGSIGGPSGNFIQSNLVVDTTYKTTCSSGQGQIASNTVFVNVEPRVNLVATPISVSPGGTTVLTWESNEVDWCTGGGGGINFSGTSRVNPYGIVSNPINSSQVFNIHCEKNPIVTPASCTGNYQKPTSVCVGSLGGNTCGFPEEGPGSECSQFSASECYVPSNPWCHHACHVSTTNTTTSCSTFTTQSQCATQSTCTWRPQTTIPGESADDSVTVTTTMHPANLPDLTMGNISPNNAIANVSKVFTATMSNIGNSATPTAINYFFQVKDSQENITDLPPQTTSILPSQESRDVTTTYKFLTNGVYQMRACADKLNRNDVGSIYEGEPNSSQEMNNCSGSWVDVTVSSHPDLIMSVVLPTTAFENTPRTFTSTMSNIGNVATPTAINYFFQVADQPEGQGNITDLSPASTGILPAQGNRNLSKSHTFTTFGVYSIRACADKLNRNDPGTINEGTTGGEENNCSSPWTNVTVSQNGPDLIAGQITPVVAIKDIPITLRSTITNQGNLRTGASFYNLFQISTLPNGGGVVSSFPTTSMMAELNPGASSQASLAHTFSSVGTYYVRACADKNNPSSSGVISETNEDNNCYEPWTPVTVSLLGNLPDLTAGAITPTVAILGVDTIFHSTITNQGNASTLIGFPVLFQAKIGENVIDLGSVTTTALNASESRVVDYSYKPTSETLSLRACADKSSAGNSGVINEGTTGGENNNCGPWTIINIMPAQKPDLTAGNVTPLFADINVSFNLNSTITNHGDVPTENSFYNFFQYYKISSTGAPVYQDLPPVLMEVLEARSSRVSTRNHTFTVAGTYNIRACADKYDRNTTTLTDRSDESNEENNCSDWSLLTVRDSSMNLPDLIADQVIPTSALLNTPINFSSNITNVGNASTLNKFNNFIQIAEFPNGAGSITDLPPVEMQVLSSGMSRTTTAQYTFTTNGTFSARACADTNNSSEINSVVSIVELSETNNCSPFWTNIIVVPTEVDASCSTVEHFKCLRNPPGAPIIATNTVTNHTNNTWTWDCEGIAGGSSASCSMPIPDSSSVACSEQLYQCSPGIPVPEPDLGGYNRWSCYSADYLTSIQCSKQINASLCNFNGIKDGLETKTDCGGPDCPPCQIAPKYKEN